ncbi:hypothetical protein B0H14DRAFT_2841530 [Mycena olivaceomarginata]|nr:hypothetical protein B0H14DRAFT_2841530 [Mycena olivaceomarginata]
MVKDPGVLKFYEREHEFCIQTKATAFCVDVVPKLGSPTSRDNAHSIGVYKVPRHLSVEEYTKRFHAVIDSWVGLPSTKEHGAKYEVWLPNLSAGYDEFQNLGFATPEPTFFIHAQSEAVEQMLEDMKNEEGQKIVLAATEEFGYAKEALLFGVDIVTKIDKS